MVVAVPRVRDAVGPDALQIRRHVARPRTGDEEVATELKVQSATSAGSSPPPAIRTSRSSVGSALTLDRAGGASPPRSMTHPREERTKIVEMPLSQFVVRPRGRRPNCLAVVAANVASRKSVPAARSSVTAFAPRTSSVLPLDAHLAALGDHPQPGDELHARLLVAAIELPTHDEPVSPVAIVSRRFRPRQPHSQTTRHPADRT